MVAAKLEKEVDQEKGPRMDAQDPESEALAPDLQERNRDTKRALLPVGVTASAFKSFWRIHSD